MLLTPRTYYSLQIFTYYTLKFDTHKNSNSAVYKTVPNFRSSNFYPPQQKYAKKSQNFNKKIQIYYFISLYDLHNS